MTRVSPDALPGRPFDADRFPAMSFEQVSLEKLKLAVQSTLSRELFSGIEVDDARLSDTLGFMSNQIAMQLIAHVWSDPSQAHSQTVEITTSPLFKTWKHQYLYGLREGSYWRRFLSGLWGIEDPSPHQETHTVEVNVPAVLPEIQRKFPDDFGRIMFPIQVTKR